MCYKLTMDRVALAALLLLFFAVPAQAGDCTCRAKGVVAKEGEFACLSTSKGRRLARCQKVLNNTSWEFTEESCGEMFTGPTPVGTAKPRQDEAA